MTRFASRSPTAPDVIAVIARHGARRVRRHARRALAAPTSLPVRSRARGPDCPQLRRDIGREPLPPPPPLLERRWMQV